MKKFWWILFSLILLLNMTEVLFRDGVARAESAEPAKSGELTDPLPKKARVTGISGFAQQYNLSCESRSAADLARFWGVKVKEIDFLNSLPRSDNPDVGFVGDVNGHWGYTPPKSYGVHAFPVAKALRGLGLSAVAHNDLAWDELRAEIAAGRPVIVWVVGHMWGGISEMYTAQDGSQVKVARYEHTMILIGYDEWEVTVIDASYGKSWSYPIKEFLRSWKVLGNMAVTVTGPLPNGEDLHRPRLEWISR